MHSQIKCNDKSTTNLDIGSSLIERNSKEYFQIAQIMGNDPGNQVLQ